MTQHNQLFQEIDEDLERQRMEALWKRYGVWVLAGAVIVLLGTAGTTAWNSWRTEKEQKVTGELGTLLDNANADTVKQIDALSAFADKNGGETQATLARLHAASLAASNGDIKKATAIYDEIANSGKADPALRQLADLYYVQVQMDSGDPNALMQRLQPLLADNAPWRYTAMEEAGFLALKAGNKEKAKQFFSELAQNTDAPPSLAARASAMVRFIGE